MWWCSWPPSRRGGSPVSASSSVVGTGSEPFVSHMVPSDSPVQRRKRYNALYAGNDSDLLPHVSRLIPAPDQCSSIFFIFMHEGRATGHNPDGIQANPACRRSVTHSDAQPDC
jgi:hypothetical protein